MSEHDDTTPGVDDAEALGATTAQDHTHADHTASSEQADDTATALDRKLTRENASLRKRLREIEAKEAERAQAELSTTERLNMQLAETTKALEERDARIRGLALQTQISNAAQRFGIIDTDAAGKLVDVSALEYDADTNAWIGVDDALRSLATDRPWLTSNGQAPASGANPTNPPRRRATLTVEQLKAMTPEEVAAIPEDELNAALAGVRR